MKTIDTVFVGINGEVTCFEHAGYSLQQAIKANPFGQMFVTDLDMWTVRNVSVENYIICQDCSA